ncbi:MAG: serine hydrolase domain-containing protein [Planctomycetaceae bacterium]
MNPDNHETSEGRNTPDCFQQAWKAQSTQTRITIDADLLATEVLRSQHGFQAMILKRDLGEVVTAIVMLPIWFLLGIGLSLPWTWYLTVLSFVWVAAFTVVDRKRHPQSPCEPEQTLRVNVQQSLTQVEHQIWLLRNVFWWYLLPFTISLMTFFAHLTWLKSENWLDALWNAPLSVFVLVLYSLIYFANQRAVDKSLEPRRQELLTLLSSLGDDMSNEATPVTRSHEIAKPSERRWLPIAVMVMLVMLATLGPAAAVEVSPPKEYPKLAPYSDIRWEETQPVVKIDGEWVTLVSIDGVAVEDIVAFSWRTYWFQWKKRFEEDLVEVLTRMGHEPGETVELVVRSLGATEDKTLKDVPMTEANRWMIKRANNWTSWLVDHFGRGDNRAPRNRDLQRASNTDIQPAQTSGPAGDSLGDLITDLRKEKNLVGLAAMVMVDGELQAAAVHGERKNGSGVPLELSDRWHLGGVAKSITATMIARLIESGQMRWTDTLGESFPEAEVHEDLRAVTLRQLLTDTAGLPNYFPSEVNRLRPALGEESMLARRAAVMDVLKEQPEYPPGEKFSYSGVGYTIAAAMAEQVTGATWSELVRREVFEPLELQGAGFVAPKSTDETLEQPRGHRTIRRLKLAMDDQAGNSLIRGPSGGVHMTLQDLCIYAIEHMCGEEGEGKLLSAETYKQLHTPELDDYACGWIRREAGQDIPHQVYWHNGSNTLWYAMIVFIPEKRMVVAVTSNDGDFRNAEAAAWEIVKAQFTTELDLQVPK